MIDTKAITTPINTTQTLRAFCSSASAFEGRQAHGNPCRVTLLTTPPEQAPAAIGITHCLSWPLGEQRAGVSCWTDQGLEIACCGHGLLSCAASWVNHWGQAGRLVMNGTEVKCHIADGLVWLGFEPLALQACEVPHWCQQFFETAPIAAATAGAADGYLVLQWPMDFEIASLPKPGANLAQHTARSLIVTRAIERAAAQHAEDFQYRYFAPQYGVSEDAATGSAMRVLASFWQQRDLGEALTAYQYSNAGGLLFSRIEKGEVWIGGRISTITKEISSIE